MPLDLLTTYLRLPVFIMVFSRLMGLIMFQPVLGALSVPILIRVLFVTGLAALVTPFVNAQVALPTSAAGLILAMGSELLLGLLIGLVVAACFVGVQMGGTMIAQESGLAFGEIADPETNESLTVLSAVYMQLATVVFLIVGGHRILLAASLDTFQSIPLLGDNGVTNVGTDLLVDSLAVGASMAIRVAAPAVVTLFLVNVALGFISRTVPQLNITTIGFSLKALIGFIIMAISLPAAMAAFVDGLDQVFGWITALTGGMPAGVGLEADL